MPFLREATLVFSLHSVAPSIVFFLCSSDQGYPSLAFTYLAGYAFKGCVWKEHAPHWRPLSPSPPALLKLLKLGPKVIVCKMYCFTDPCKNLIKDVHPSHTTQTEDCMYSYNYTPHATCICRSS